MTEEPRSPLEPIADNVVILPIEEAESTIGGVILPQQAQDRPVRGLVVARGPGKLTTNGKMIEMEVEPGDTVLFSRHSRTEFTHNGQEYLIVTHDNVYGIYVE